MNTTTSSLIARLTARPGCASALETILLELVEATARTTGAITYALSRVEGASGSYIVCEQYDDEASRTIHLRSEWLQAALERAAPLLAVAPELTALETFAAIRQNALQVAGVTTQSICLPIGPVHLVAAWTSTGFLGCGAFDPAVFARFGIAAANVRPLGTSIASVDELLEGAVRSLNDLAASLGVTAGMCGREALALLVGTPRISS